MNALNAKDNFERCYRARRDLSRRRPFMNKEAQGIASNFIGQTDNLIKHPADAAGSMFGWRTRQPGSELRCLEERALSLLAVPLRALPGFQIAA
jgi:hypothetical protein